VSHNFDGSPVNVVGGALILDMLSTEEVEEMVDKYLAKYYGLEIQGQLIGETI
jgi:hypothetical protein